MLSQWNLPSGAVEMATVTNVPVLLFKMRCMFLFHCKESLLKTCLRVHSQKIAEGVN